MYCPYGAMMGGWGWLMMAGGTLLILAVVILGAFLFSRTINPPTARAVDGPQRILAERYARGEIDDQEYQQRLSVLRGDASR